MGLYNTTVRTIDVNNAGLRDIFWNSEESLPKYGLARSQLSAAVQLRVEQLGGQRCQT